MKNIFGTFKYADGTFVQGKVYLWLPQDAVAVGDAQIAPSQISFDLVDGSFSDFIYFTDELSPSGLTYSASVVATGGGLVWGAESFPVNGTSFNLNNAQPTNSGILLANAVLQNPTGAQTILNFNLSISNAQLLLSNGTMAAPAQSFINETNSGLYRAGSQDLRISVNATDSFRIDSTSPTVPSGRPLAWGSAGVTSRDFGICRIGSAVGALGNGTQGDASGVLILSAVKQNTNSVFSISDANGVTHFFLSSSAPYTNTFIQGNGSGSTFIGTGNFAVNIPDNSNLIQFKGATSGTINLVPAAISGSTILTLPNAGTDTLVAKSTTDNLQNKNLTGATTGNTISIVNPQGSTAALTGDSTDKVIYTYSLPANTVDTSSKGIRITASATHNSGTANVTCKININGVSAVTGAIGTTASQSVFFQATILRTGSTTGGSAGIATVSGALNPFSLSLTGLAWGSNQTITFTFNVASPDQMTGIMFLVEQLQ